jgi:predicted nucleic acid-binding protein
MVYRFYDISAVGKHYHAEVGTPRVDQLLAEPNVQHVISRLTAVEVQAVFASKVRTGGLKKADFRRLRRRFLADVGRRQYYVVKIVQGHYREAERLIQKYAPTRSLRTLDAVQLAVALSLHRQKRLDEFVCADANLCKIAQLEGLKIINPERP